MEENKSRMSNNTRVSIPHNLEKMIEDIKEVVMGKHSADDVYSMLKESNMDPNEVVQKILFLEEKSTTMRSGAGGNVSSGSRVQIPSGVRKTILDIKEIAAGKHSDDDIYAMLKECNMDPNETVQKLLYLDTFHEVKKKREKRNVNVGRASEEYRWASGMQRRGARGGQENYPSSNFSVDSGGRRQVGGRQENGMNNYAKRNFKASAASLQRREGTTAPTGTNSSTPLMDGRKNVPKGGFNCEAASQVDNTSDANKFSIAADSNMSNITSPLADVSVKQLQSSMPGHTAPYPTIISTVLPGNVSEVVTPASVSGIYSSASDPVLVPSLKPRNPGAVGTIKRGKGTFENATESISFQDESRLSADQNMGNSGQADSVNVNSSSKPSVPPDIGMDQHSEPPHGLFLTNNGSPAVGSIRDGWPAKPVHGPLDVTVPQAEAVMVEYNVTSSPKSNVTILDQATPELDKKLQKLSISTYQPVIFPDHLQVPEALRKGLTFGSLDATLGQSGSCEKVSAPTSENVTNLAGKELSQSNHPAPTTAKEGEHSNRPPSRAAETEKLSTLGDIESSDAASKSDQANQETLAPVILQPGPDYSFGFVPPVLGPHFVQLDGAEPQGGNSMAPCTSCSSPPLGQPSGLGQNSFAFPPQLLPFLRQPYPPNFIPYNPYFPHLYVPHNAPEFLGHGVLPQHHLAANLHVPPAAAVKLPVPAVYKMGNIAGNLTQSGVPSGYGPYGASAIGYSPSLASTSGSSGGNEDHAAPELKEKNMYSALKQNEEPQAWNSTTGRDMSTMQANYFYNIPPGQRVAFSPAHSGHGPYPGVYPLSQIPAPSPVQSLAQQSPATAGPVEVIVPTSTYQQQPHPQFNWNSRILNRENI